MTAELTPNERAALAREVAADNRGYDVSRQAFLDGWDAAIDYVSKRASEGVAHLDGDDECCHFQD